MNSPQILILYSGGLDSFILYHMAIKIYGENNVKCVFFKHGQNSEQAEINALPDFVEIRELDWLDENIKAVSKISDPFAGHIYIPGRNLVFCVTAASQYLPDEIWMGTVVDEDNQSATDKNDTFRIMTENILNYVLGPFHSDGILIRFPFVEENMTKVDAVEWALEHNVSKEEIIGTTSCWHNKDGIPCGECKQCIKRFLVFALNNIEEEYHISPLHSKVSLNLMLEYLQSPPSNDDEQNMQNMICEFLKLRNKRFKAIRKLERAIENVKGI